MNNGNLEFLYDYSVSVGTITANLLANARYHIVCVMSSSGVVTAYVNGASIGTLNMSAYTYAGSYVRIGADGSNSTTVGVFMTGEMDEVAVYNAALTATQITNHYNAGK